VIIGIIIIIIIIMSTKIEKYINRRAASTTSTCKFLLFISKLINIHTDLKFTTKVDI